MKTIIHLFASSIFLCLCIGLQAQNTFSRTIEKDFKNVEKVSITHRNGPVHVRPSGDDKVHIYAEVKVTSKSTEEADKALALIDIAAHMSGDLLTIGLDTELEDYNSHSSWKEVKRSIFGKKKDDPLDVNRENYRVDLIVEVPDLDRLSVENKYEPVQIDVAAGQLEILGFESDATVSVDAGDTRIRSKYSTIHMQDAGRVDMQLFECEYTAGTTGELEINAKYSEITLDACGDIDIDGFETEMEIHQFGRLRGDMKYSSLTDVVSAGEVDLVLFECELEIDQVGSLTATNAKYSDFEISSLGRLRGNALFECDFHLGTVGVLDLSGKYCDVEAVEIQESIRFEGFEGSIESKRLGSRVDEIHIDGKYMKLSLPVEKGYGLQLNLHNSSVHYLENGKRQTLTGEIKTIRSLSDGDLQIHLSGFSMEADLTK